MFQNKEGRRILILTTFKCTFCDHSQFPLNVKLREKKKRFNKNIVIKDDHRNARMRTPFSQFHCASLSDCNIR